MLSAAAALVLSCVAPLQSSGEIAATLELWRKSFVAGRFELGGPARDGGRSAAMYRGLLTDRRFELSHQQALEVLLDHAIERQTDDVVRELLRLAAVGLADDEVEVARRPDVVRSAAVSTLGQLTETSALWVLLQTARGERDGWRRWHPQLQAAALRGLGAVALPVARPTIERQLTSELPEVRLAAADALAALAPPRALDSVCDAIERETDALVAARLIETAHGILRRGHDDCETADVRRTVLAACAAIGRHGSWHTDLAAVELCADFRSSAAVEPLVRVLERFRDEPDAIDRGELSGLLRHRAHEVLESLTGARIAIDDAAGWRAFWERVRGGFVLAAEPARAPAHTSSGFFGIPIVGTRVVFVIDRSGSMKADHVGDDGEVRSRFESACAELLRAAGALPGDTGFNVVTFAVDVRPWVDGFAEPTAAKLAELAKQLRRLPVDGGTNIHGGLELALSLRVARFGQRYESPVDEVFLLSDGAPTAGEIVDPEAILAVVRDRNRTRRVRINTVFIGSESEAGFMQRLAEENGGRFVRL